MSSLFLLERCIIFLWIDLRVVLKRLQMWKVKEKIQLQLQILTRPDISEDSPKIEQEIENVKEQMRLEGRLWPNGAKVLTKKPKEVKELKKKKKPVWKMICSLKNVDFSGTRKCRRKWRGKGEGEDQTQIKQADQGYEDGGWK